MYTPQKDDFEFISDRELAVDENFASQGYWRGVAVHFCRNRFAVTGVILVSVVILFAIFAPIESSYSYDEIVSVTDSNGKVLVAKSLPPQFSGDGQNPFADKTFLFGTDDMGRDLWTRTWQGARVSLIIAFVAIFTEAFLSFVGGGIVLPQCSIGSLIEAGFNLIGDGLREALAPKLEDQ